MTLGPPYHSNGFRWRNVRSWNDGELLPAGYQVVVLPPTGDPVWVSGLGAGFPPVLHNLYRIPA